MSIIQPNAIFIGPPQISDYLASKKPEWNFLPPEKSIQTVYKNIETEVYDVQIILIVDRFFTGQEDDKLFQDFVSFMGQYCFVGVINYFRKQDNYGNVPDYGETQTQEMIDAIENSAAVYGFDSRFYLIDPNRPMVSLDNAIDTFLQEYPEKAESAAEYIRGEVDSEYINEQTVEKAEEALNQIHQTSPIKNIETDVLGQVVSVTSSKGGSGKSTIATTLASYIALASKMSVKLGLEKRPLKVCIVDMDIRDGQLGFITGKVSPTILQLRIDGITVENVKKVIHPNPRMGCDLLLAPKRPRHSEDTPPDFYREVINLLKTMYDYIIVDTSVNYTDPLLESVAYPIADQIVFVTDVVVSSTFGMARWIMEVTPTKEQNGMGISANKIGIVVNKYMPGIEMSAEKISKSSMGLPIISIVPSAPKLVAHATNIQSVELLLKHNEFMPSIRLLAKSVVGRKYKLADGIE